MTDLRWDETWHRLLMWTDGQGPSERLAAQILLHDEFTHLDPSHPLGGKDGGQDATCRRNGKPAVMAVYFPRGQQDFGAIQKKFRADLAGAKADGIEWFAFVTNQELRLGERRLLSDEWPDHVELYHLERITAILDTPTMAEVRRQFLGIDLSPTPGGRGGSGGSGTIFGNRGTIVGGRGGAGGVGGRSGDGAGGIVHGDDALIIGGDGGSAGTADGRGGRAARSPLERANGHTAMWIYGKGGAGANASEYNRRLGVLTSIRLEYVTAFPDERPFIEAGVDHVPVNWVNKRLEELSESWRVEEGPSGYVLPPLANHSS